MRSANVNRRACAGAIAVAVPNVSEISQRMISDAGTGHLSPTRSVVLATGRDPDYLAKWIDLMLNERINPLKQLYQRGVI